METKTFTNSFGKGIELTREEYIDRWVKSTWQFGALINTYEEGQAFQEFQNTIRKSAGKEWDNAK